MNQFNDIDERTIYMILVGTSKKLLHVNILELQDVLWNWK